MRFLSLTALVCVPAALAQQALSPSIDAAFAAYTALPDRLLPVLRAVVDTKSADQAAVRLHELLPHVYESCTAIKAIESLTPQEQSAVKSKYEKAMREKWGEVYTEMFRLQKKKYFHSHSFTQSFGELSMLLDS